MPHVLLPALIAAGDASILAATTWSVFRKKPSGEKPQPNFWEEAREEVAAICADFGLALDGTPLPRPVLPTPPPAPVVTAPAPFWARAHPYDRNVVQSYTKAGRYKRAVEIAPYDWLKGHELYEWGNETPLVVTEDGEIRPQRYFCNEHFLCDGSCRRPSPPIKTRPVKR